MFGILKHTRDQVVSQVEREIILQYVSHLPVNLKPSEPFAQLKIGKRMNWTPWELLSQLPSGELKKNKVS